jgi:hypothetical protein
MPDSEITYGGRRGNGRVRSAGPASPKRDAGKDVGKRRSLKKMFFSEEKNQQTFIPRTRIDTAMATNMGAAEGPKSFASFLQKRRPCLFSLQREPPTPVLPTRGRKKGERA